jgi:hypothetical protein
MLAKESVERLTREPGQLGVAEGDHVGAARTTGDQAHLPYGIAGGNPPDKTAIATLCGRKDAQTPAQNDVQGVRRITRGKQRGAAGQRQPLGSLRDLAQKVEIEVLEQR